MSFTLAIRHNAELAHRLTKTAGKCESIHGHSVWFTIRLAAPQLADDDTAGVMFGDLKHAVRGWIDTTLDHRTVLNATDPLADLLADHGQNITRLDGDPTTENLARITAQHVGLILPDLDPTGQLTVASVWVDETHVNGAGWHA